MRIRQLAGCVGVNPKTVRFYEHIGLLPAPRRRPSGYRDYTGFRIVTLTNGSTDTSEHLFARAGIRDRFEKLLSVDHVGTWKPGRAADECAAQTCGTDLARALAA